MGHWLTGAERTCPICSGTFCPTPQWAYKANRDILFCTYGCMRKWQKNPNLLKNRVKKPTTLRMTDVEKQKMIIMLKDGISMHEIARRIGVTEQTILYHKKKMVAQL